MNNERSIDLCLCRVQRVDPNERGPFQSPSLTPSSDWLETFLKCFRLVLVYKEIKKDRLVNNTKCQKA